MKTGNKIFTVILIFLILIMHNSSKAQSKHRANIVNAFVTAMLDTSQSIHVIAEKYLCKMPASDLDRMHKYRVGMDEYFEDKFHAKAYKKLPSSQQQISIVCISADDVYVVVNEQGKVIMSLLFNHNNNRIRSFITIKQGSGAKAYFLDLCL